MNNALALMSQNLALILHVQRKIALILCSSCMPYSFEQCSCIAAAEIIWVTSSLECLKHEFFLSDIGSSRPPQFLLRAHLNLNPVPLPSSCSADIPQTETRTFQA